MHMDPSAVPTTAPTTTQPAATAAVGCPGGPARWSASAVIAEVLPELTRLIGDQPPVALLGTAETANRFNMVFLQLVGCLGSASSPLVLFVDDLQWADGGSLSLLRLMLSHEPAHLLLIGAYRDNEVDAAHPLSRLIAEARADHSERVTAVCLQALSTAHIAQLLVDSFRCEAETAAQLAQLLASRTQGNPFYLTQLLKSYVDGGLIRFDFSSGAWLCDLAAMQLAAVPADVVALVCRHMRALSCDAQCVLQYASCSGNRVTMHALLLITRMSVSRLARAAIELEQAGMLWCVEHARDLLLLAQARRPDADADADPSAAEAEDAESVVAAATGAGLHAAPMPSQCAALSASASVGAASASASAAPSLSPSFVSRLASVVLQFAHDRVQAAAYKLIPPDRIGDVHCVIASQLMRSYAPDELEEYALDICGHINAAGLREFCTDDGGDDNRGAGDAASASATTAASASASAAVSPSTPTLARGGGGRSGGWRAFFAQPGMVERVIALQVAAARQAKASSAYDSAQGLLTAALQLLQRQAQLDQRRQRTEGASSHSTSGSSSVPSPTDPFATMVIDSDECAGAGSGAGSTVAAGTGACSSAGVPPSPSSSPSFLRVGADCWSRSYDWCLSIYRELVDCQFLQALYADTRSCIEYVLEHVRVPLDRAGFFELHVQAYNQQQLLAEAEQCGLRHLSELGVSLLPSMSPSLSSWCFSVDPCDERSHSLHPVLSCEPMSRPMDLIVMQVLSSLVPSMFVLPSSRFPSLVITMLQHTMTRGSSPDAGLSFACMGIVLFPSNQLALAFAMGQVGKLLLAAFGDAGRSAGPRADAALPQEGAHHPAGFLQYLDSGGGGMCE